jgi:hypothetical protein
VGRAFHDSPFETRSKHPIHPLRESPAARLTKAIPMQIDVYLPNVHGRRVVVDAKYKTRIATANLQRMINYCIATGAQDAVLVFQPVTWTTSARISSSRHTQTPRPFGFTSLSSTLRRRSWPAGMRPDAGWRPRLS